MTTLISYAALWSFGGILAFVAAFLLFMIGISTYTAFKLPRLARGRTGGATMPLPERLEVAKAGLRAQHAPERS